MSDANCTSCPPGIPGSVTPPGTPAATDAASSAGAGAGAGAGDGAGADAAGGDGSLPPSALYSACSFGFTWTQAM